METTVRTQDNDALVNLANGIIDGDLVVNGSIADSATKVELTNAEIKALVAAPKTLVAAPGAGKTLQFVSATLRVIAGTEVLAEDGGGSNLGIKYKDGTGVQVSDTIEATGFIDQLTNAQTSAVPVKDAIVADEAGCVNQPLVLHNIGAGEIVGNASNDATAEVHVSYRVLTTA